MKKKVIVLGCGQIGATIARDLAADAGMDVSVADADRKNLDRVTAAPKLKTIQADLGAAGHVKALVKEFDLVVGALPSVLGFETLRAALESGKPCCDISFMSEDALELDALARRRGVTAVVDCGVAPGLSNLIVGHCHAAFDRTERVLIYVGGLPIVRRWPYQYTAPFAPSDVLEEYTRPARIVENGRVVVRPALSEPELIDFPTVGTLEAFNTDGLRSLIGTIDAPDMMEKTLRYPGHSELMRVLRETGLFDKRPIAVGGVKVRPLDVTSRLLFPMWAPEPDQRSFTLLRVIAEGQKDGGEHRHIYDLYDEDDAETGQTSMARTTGFPCAIVARLLAGGDFAEPGVFPPESLARRPGMLDHVTRELAPRGVTLTHRIEALPSPIRDSE